MKLRRFASRQEIAFIPTTLRGSDSSSRPNRRIHGRVSFNSNDPQMHVEFVPKFLAGLDRPVFVCVTSVLSGEIIEPYLYLDRGDGFSEESPSKYPLKSYNSGNTVVVTGAIDTVAEIRRVRFDPSLSRCALDIIGAGWTDGAGIKLILTAAKKRRFASLGDRLIRFVYRLLPVRQQTKKVLARGLLPRRWLQAIDLAPSPAGHRANLHGGQWAPVETVYSELWQRAHETGFDPSRGALAVRQVDAARCDTRLVAYYLPQYHPTPENDAWWGRGFTDWRNVTKGLPVFAGHYQPKLPGELGFYDLRIPDVMTRQVELARLYGLSAFCFHFYWFGGRRLLETPIEHFLESKDLNLGFCLCWANESWTRRWDGAEEDVLIGQRHSPEDDIAFIRYIHKYFDDKRYLRIGGRPIITVYRPALLADPNATVARWRNEAKCMGLPGLYIVATNSFGFTDFAQYGFDAISEYPPHGTVVPDIRSELNFVNYDHSGAVYRYRDVVSAPAVERSGRVLPGVMPAWDNCARRPRHGHLYHESTPELFRHWLDSAISRARLNPVDERIVMINAWNEWAEGAYLEPDHRFGYGYLAACGSAISDHSEVNPATRNLFAEMRCQFRPRRRLAVILHLFYDSLASEFAKRIGEFGENVDIYVTVPRDLSPTSAQQIAILFPGAYVQEGGNRGRDILPFYNILDVIAKGGHEFVCKLHTKKSPHLKDGESWRSELVAGLLSDKARQKLEWAQHRPKIGILCAQGSLAYLSNEPVRRHTMDRIVALANMLKLRITLQEPFVAGSMFWFRPRSLAALADIVSRLDFEPELGQIDGALSHVLERMSVIAARGAGFDVEVIDTPPVAARQY